MSRLKSQQSPDRLRQLSEERDKLQTEFVQIHSMLLSIEELIVEEILNQASEPAPGKASEKKRTAKDYRDSAE